MAVTVHTWRVEHMAVVTSSNMRMSLITLKRKKSAHRAAFTYDVESISKVGPCRDSNKADFLVKNQKEPN